MGFCMGCGKQIENGDYCTECSANMQQAQPAPAVGAATPVAAAAPKKGVFNGKMIAMLSLLGVFGAVTIVVGVLFN